MALVLEKEDAVDTWKALLGPKEVEVAQIEAPDRYQTWNFCMWIVGFLLSLVYIIALYCNKANYLSMLAGVVF